MPQNNFWGCKLPDFHLLTGKTPFLRLLEKIQSPYTLLAAFPRTWYNREESHLGQLEFFSGCSFLIALNMILHLRIISLNYFLEYSEHEISAILGIPKHTVNRRKRKILNSIKKLME